MWKAELKTSITKGTCMISPCPISVSICLGDMMLGEIFKKKTSHPNIKNSIQFSILTGLSKSLDINITDV